MSIRLTSRVYELKLDAKLQRVLLLLCDHANDDGVCWPSFDRMAWALGLNERTIRRAVDDLEVRGVVTIERHIGRANTYHIHLDRLPEKAPFKGRKPGQNVRTTDNEATDKMSALQDEKRGQNVRTTPDILSQSAGQNVHLTIEPSEEPSINSDASLTVMQGGSTKPAVQGDTPAHRFVNVWYAIVGGHPTNHGRDLGNAKTIQKAGIGVDEIPAFVSWLRGSWYGKDGIDLNAAVRAANAYQSTKTAPQPKKRLVV